LYDNAPSVNGDMMPLYQILVWGTER